MLKKISNKSGAFGYNADTDSYGDLIKQGVIDPTKVVRSALENAASVARILLSTACLITDKPKKEYEGGGMGHEDMDDMM